MPILRTFTNKPGSTFDAEKTAVVFAEDMNDAGDALDDHESRIGTLESNPTPPVKATGAELNAGTDDAKFATAKALADSDYAKTSDIPTVPVKATGAELNAGTDDAKFLTAKAVADSAYKKPADIMKAVFSLGRSSYQENSSGSTNYFDATFWAPNESSAGTIIPFAGVLKNLYIDMYTNSINAGTIVFTVMKNGVATGITVTVNAGVTSITGDTTHTASVSAGDRFTLRVVSGGSSGSFVFAYSLVLQ